jgi:MraZ protein
VRFIGINDAIEIWAVEKTQQPFLPQEEFAEKLKAIMTVTP